MSDEHRVVELHSTQTRVSMERADRSVAIQAAFNVTMSPHEQVWTTDQQAAMAQYVLWAHQRLSAISDVMHDRL